MFPARNVNVKAKSFWQLWWISMHWWVMCHCRKPTILVWCQKGNDWYLGTCEKCQESHHWHSGTAAVKERWCCRTINRHWPSKYVTWLFCCKHQQTRQRATPLMNWVQVLLHPSKAPRGWNYSNVCWLENILCVECLVMYVDYINVYVLNI